MSTGNPPFNSQIGIKEQEHLSPEFLQRQIRLSREEWDERFRALINEESKKNQENFTQFRRSSKIIEARYETTFNRYLRVLGLDTEKIKDKRIIDLGCGEGEFVKYCIEKGIASEAYGVDSRLGEDIIIDDEFKGNFFKGSFEDDLPVKDADFIISVGAVSLSIWCDKEFNNVKRIIEKALVSLKKDGVIIIASIVEPSKATPLPYATASYQKWDELLAEISESQGVEYKIEPIEIKVTGENNDIILQSVLIIRRKKS